MPECTLYREVEHWTQTEGVETELREAGTGTVADVVAALTAIRSFNAEYLYGFLVRGPGSPYLVRAAKWLTKKEAEAYESSQQQPHHGANGVLD